MELKSYLSILWRRKWVIAVTMCAALIAAIAGLGFVKPMYAASATFRVSTARSGSVDWVNYDLMYADRIMNTYAKIATSVSFLEELRLRFNLSAPPKVEVEILSNTELFRISVKATDPVLAMSAANSLANMLVRKSTEFTDLEVETNRAILEAQVANAERELNQARQDYGALRASSSRLPGRLEAAQRLVDQKQETYTLLLQNYDRARLRGALRTNTLSVVEPAMLPEEPSEPRTSLVLALSLLLGALGGLGVAFLFENLDTTLYSADQVEATARLPALGKIPKARGITQAYPFNGSTAQGEAFRRVRTNLLNLDCGAEIRSLLVTSAQPGEGKSTMVSSLGYAFAQMGRRVALVDSDLRRPSLHLQLDLPNEMGLSDVLEGRATTGEAVQCLSEPELLVLTSGSPAGNPAELLASRRMAELIMQLEEDYDLVLLDSPSLDPLADSATLVPLVDAIILVARLGKVRRETLQTVSRQISEVSSKPVFMVINGEEPEPGYFYYRASKAVKL